MLASALGMVNAASVTAPVLGAVISMMYLYCFIRYQPFIIATNNFLCIILIYSTTFCFLGAIMAKIDISGENSRDRQTYEMLLLFVIMSGPCLILAKSLTDNSIAFINANAPKWAAAEATKKEEKKNLEAELKARRLSFKGGKVEAKAAEEEFILKKAMVELSLGKEGAATEELQKKMADVGVVLNAEKMHIFFAAVKVGGGVAEGLAAVGMTDIPETYELRHAIETKEEDTQSCSTPYKTIDAEEDDIQLSPVPLKHERRISFGGTVQNGTYFLGQRVRVRDKITDPWRGGVVKDNRPRVLVDDMLQSYLWKHIKYSEEVEADFKKASRGQRNLQARRSLDNALLFFKPRTPRSIPQKQWSEASPSAEVFATPAQKKWYAMKSPPRSDQSSRASSDLAMLSPAPESVLARAANAADSEDAAVGRGHFGTPLDGDRKKRASLDEDPAAGSGPHLI